MERTLVRNTTIQTKLVRLVRVLFVGTTKEYVFICRSQDTYCVLSKKQERMLAQVGFLI